MLNLDKNKELNKQVNDYVDQFFDNHEKTGNVFITAAQHMSQMLGRMSGREKFITLRSSSGHTMEMVDDYIEEKPVEASSGAVLKSDGNKMIWDVIMSDGGKMLDSAYKKFPLKVVSPKIVTSEIH